MKEPQTGFLFIGGPWDGRRIVMKSPAPRHMRVAKIPNAVTSFEEAKAIEWLHVEHYTYEKIAVPGQSVYVLADWVEGPDGLARVVGALVRGYSAGSWISEDP